MAQTPIQMLGSMAFLMLQSRYHQGLSLEQVRDLCLPPIEAGLAVVAHAPEENGVGGAPLAYALCGKVSDEWDARLRDPKFALTDLPRAAWTSGTHPWVLDFLPVAGQGPRFAMKAAAAVFEAGSPIHVRLREADGRAVVSERTV